MLTGLPFIGVTPSGASACMSRQEHALSPKGQRLPQPVGGPSVRDSSCHALGGGPQVWYVLRWVVVPIEAQMENDTRN